MTANAEAELNHAFVLGSAELQKLWEILERRFGGVEAAASCADGIERSFSTLDEFLAFENPASKRLRAVRLTATGQSILPSATLSFRSSGPLPIRLQFRASEEDVTVAKSAVLDVVEGSKPWFSPLARLDFHFVFLAFAFFGWLFMKAVTGSTPQQDPVSPRAAIVVVVLFCLLMVAVVVVAWGLNRLRERFFPIGTFALGQGEKRYHTDEHVRWVVLVGLCVSILGSMFVSLIV